MPEEGQVIVFNNIKLTIEKINKKRIVSIKIELTKK